MNAKTQPKPKGAPRERILEVASDLFYRQGYRATGINEVIAKSGVAKATFYSHFPTKDDLALAYLQEAMQGEIAHVESFIRSGDGPVDRYLSVMASLEPWLRRTEFRGCPFINMASEVPDPASPLRQVSRHVYDYVRHRVRTLVEDLIASDKTRYGHLDPDAVAREYLVCLAGAIAMAEIYHGMWPVENAMDAVRRLIGEEEG